MTEQTTPQLLHEIADVMEENGMSIEGVWQVRPGNYHDWGEVDHPVDLIDASMKGWQVRRRPRTIKVSGEVSEEVSELARQIVRNPRFDLEVDYMACALFDLIENGES